MTIIFTDGSSRGNPGSGGFGTIVATEDKVYELGGREVATTNNRMELMAAIKSLQSVGHESEVTVYTDSAYLVSGITRWVKGWKKNNWKTSQKEDVLNRDLWEELDQATAHRVINWKLIKGHSGNPANERCDVIATSFADGKTPVLYNGSRERYGISLETTFEVTPSKSKSKRAAYSYVSLVDGKIEIHKTWEECKARVHGVPGSRFKKSVSPEDEEEIIKNYKL